jgi:D-glycero-D-manno-heptose 1,7-bisphosphate phosphatase
MMKRPAVFFDRDGVLNRAIVRDGKPYPPNALAELELVPDADEFLTALKNKGFLLVVVTNQPDVARGKQTQAAVEEIHRFMAERLPIDLFRVCYHDDKTDCVCRKPRPGLLTSAAAELGVDLSASYMVGDRWRDVDAGAAAGCRTVWIDCGYLERGPSNPPDAIVLHLSEAVQWILKDYRERNANENRQ